MLRLRAALGADALRLTLENAGRAPLVVYAAVAAWAAQAGWMGPSWSLDGMRELRTWYGPPGHPPNEAYFRAGARRLQPGEAHETVFPVARYAPGELPAVALAPATLDPEGMDGLAGVDLAAGGLLVVGRDRAALDAESRRRPDFLRPGLVVPLPPGQRGIAVGYRQEDLSATATLAL